MLVESGRIYQHKYGGIYQVEDVEVVDDELMVIYSHLWPFDRRTYKRPYAEWTADRFTLLTHEEAVALMEESREVGQQRVTEAKNQK